MRKTAFVFAGQGSQFVGMGQGLREAIPLCDEYFKRASEALGYDVEKLCLEGPIEALTRTDLCQPAIFTVSAICAAALRERCPRLRPFAVAGLSLGEWTALFEAGVLDFEDTVRVLEERGRAMQEACEKNAGAMVSVLGMSPETVASLAFDAGVQVSNINAPDQVVFSGAQQAVSKAAACARNAGARKTIPLNVAGAYHSQLMQPAAERLAETLKKMNLRSPVIPVLSNVTGKPHGDPSDVKCAMVAQLVSTVRWLDNVRWLLDQGVNLFIECGPGKVLGNLIKRLDSSVMTVNIQDYDSLEEAVARISEG